MKQPMSGASFVAHPPDEPLDESDIAMETVSIRNLRGENLAAIARSGKPQAITNHRALIGVLIPVAAAWVEHLIDYNWSHVRQSIAEGEQAMASDDSMATLDEVIAEGHGADRDEGQALRTPERLVAPLVAAVTGEAVTQAPQSKEAVEWLQTALNPHRPATGPAQPWVRTVRIGDLSAKLIEQAGEAGQTLAITHDRELLGILIPVTQGLVQFLIEQNMSRVLYNIGLGEKQLAAPDRLTTLDQLFDAGPTAGAGPSSPATRA
jgi:hypothetical protein